MAVNDLFSFLEEDPTHEQDNDDVPEVMDVDAPASPNRAATPETKKRKAERSNGHASSSIENEGVEGSAAKKRRVEPSYQPVVVDEFETEAKREVIASAGLTESADAVGSRLELKHQVRSVLLGFFFCIGDTSPDSPSRANAFTIKQRIHDAPRFLFVLHRSDIRSLSLQDMTTSQYRNMCHPRSPRVNTSSRWILSNKFRFMRFSGMRAYSSRRIPVRERPWWLSMPSPRHCRISKGLSIRVL